MSTPRRNSLHRDAPAGAGRELFTAGVAAATSVGLSPRWVHYSGVSATARLVAEVLVDMATMRPAGDQAPVLDRERLAYHVGVGRADKLAPAVAELVGIGFLTIYSGGVDPVTGRRRQRRDTRGRPVPDRFVVALQPPADYAGPSTLTEADASFAVDRDAAYQAARAGGRRARTSNITIHRLGHRPATNRQVRTDPGFGGQGPAGDPGIGGQREFPQVRTDTQIRGQVDATDPGIGGQPAFPQVRTDTEIRGHLQRERSSISPEGREIEEIEPVPGGSAPPPATGPASTAGGPVGSAVALAEQPVPAALPAPVEDPAGESSAVEGPAGPVPAGQVRALVRQLPWSAWAALRRPGWRLSTADADQVQAAITEAITGRGISLPQAAEIAQAALSEATGAQPVTYLVNAFTRHLARRLRALDLEPLDDAPLPLLTQAAGPSEPLSRPQKRPPAPSKAEAAAAAQRAVQAEREGFRVRVEGCQCCDDNGIAHDPVLVDGHPRAVRCTHDTTHDATPDDAADQHVSTGSVEHAVTVSSIPDQGDGPATRAGREAAMAMVRAHLENTPAGRRRAARGPSAARPGRAGTVTR
ncbi:hypothetical protein [Pseudonocardia sp. ICBG1293]|uniref:hypothetical protein n=1 Tax=Pseudonocardia sp. ICBG1293 TaxID=2844382 RepID=UPI001CCC9A53|nr:hypothetical protein [Pseudonocardia sp. ICBG1293]